MKKQTLYDDIKEEREHRNQPYYRVMIGGYLKDEVVKRDNINPEKLLRDSITPYHSHLTGYLYIKGIFYLHLLESKDIKHINDYLYGMYKMQCQESIHQEIKVAYQSYESGVCFFKGWQCDNIVQAGPVLTETEKTEQQIADRSYEIYEALEEGAKKKRDNPSHKISNMFLLSNDDMSILISDRFISLSQYYEMYIKTPTYERQAEVNYPLPPSIFNVMEFLEIQNYEMYK